jgi:hypothetical protein
MKWPEGKDFAFTIVDDTDFATVANIKPVYEYIAGLGFRTTKTTWVYPSRDQFSGDCLGDAEYLQFILSLKKLGFEIASHGVASGDYTRPEILKGLGDYKARIGQYPEMHINHARNKSNLYWGSKRFLFPLKALMSVKRENEFWGEIPGSDFFWGDFAKQNIKYIRNLTFSEINTLRADPRMPYLEKKKERFSNFWFSSSDGHTVEEFNDLITPSNITKLQKEGGCCIVYTHFASDFMKDGTLNSTFVEQMKFLAKQNGWFVPASKILDYLLSQRSSQHVSSSYLIGLNVRWLRDRILKKLRYKR